MWQRIRQSRGTLPVSPCSRGVSPRVQTENHRLRVCQLEAESDASTTSRRRMHASASLAPVDDGNYHFSSGLQSDLPSDRAIAMLLDIFALNVLRRTIGLFWQGWSLRLVIAGRRQRRPFETEGANGPHDGGPDSRAEHTPNACRNSQQHPVPRQ
jgi:hypothetical protein